MLTYIIRAFLVLYEYFLDLRKGPTLLKFRNRTIIELIQVPIPGNGVILN